MAGGQEITTGTGTLTPSQGDVATGTEVAVAQGEHGKNRLHPLRSRKTGGGTATFALSGQQITASAGIPVKELSVAPSGSALTVSAGSMAVSGADVPDTDAPALFFSDLTSGPSTGNTDTSQGMTSGTHGCYVTVWGKRLGASQGSSTIVCCGAAPAVVIYWGAAVSPYSPAEFDNGYQDYQCIIFQVSASASSGAGEIRVTVGGKQSNAIAFTVRSGRIMYCSTGGLDSSAGTWTSPVRTMPGLVTRMNQAGDIGYVLTGVTQTTSDGINGYFLQFDTASGTEAAPIAMVAYPGALATISSTLTVGGNWGIRALGQDAVTTYHWITVAKLRITIGGDIGIHCGASNGHRIVGCYFAGANHSNLSDGGWISTNAANNIYILGNEFDTIGSPMHYHCVYLSGSRQREVGAEVPMDDREVAYNYFHGVQADRAITMFNYGQVGPSYDPLSNHRVHHNLIVDQYGDGIMVGVGFEGSNYVYSNLIIRAGKGPFPITDVTQHVGINLRMGAGTTYVHNNTFVDCGHANTPPYPTDVSGGLLFGGTSYNFVSLKNNIFYQTNSQPYVASVSPVPGAQDATKWSHNLYFGNGAAPSWVANSVNSNPLFTAAGEYDLQATSPARDAGTSIVQDPNVQVMTDFDGVPLPDAQLYDIGALEFVGLPSWVTALSIGQQYKIPNSSFKQASVLAQYTVAHPDRPHTSVPGGYSLSHATGSFVHVSGSPDLAYRFAYSGMPFDPFTSTCYTFGGGHAASFGNEILKFNANQEAPTWEVLVQPSAAVDVSFCHTAAHKPPLVNGPGYPQGAYGNYNVDGKPPAAHMSTRNFYLPGDKSLWNFGGGVTFAGGSQSIDRCDLNSDSPTYRQWSAPNSYGNAWSSFTPNLGSREYRDCAVVDPNTDTVYMIKWTGGGIYRWGGPAAPLTFTHLVTLSATYTINGVDGFVAWGHCFDTTRNKIVIATGGDGPGGNTFPLYIRRIPTSAPYTPTLETPVWGSITPFQLNYAFGFEYDPDEDRYLIYKGNGTENTIWTIDATTLEVGRIDPTGDQITGGAFIGWCQTRFRYAPELGGTLFVHIPASDINGSPPPNLNGSPAVYFVRLR